MRWRSANAQAIGHLTRALEMLESLPENPERERLALEFKVMLGQAKIADRGYAAPEPTATPALSLFLDRADRRS
jgi:hypothetical protein